MTPIVNYRTLTQDAAEAIVQAAKQAGAKLDSPFYKGHKVKMHIHVIGRECTLMAATQAFGAWPGSDDIATRKAKTAFYFKLPTRTIGELSRPELAAKGPLYAIEVSNGALISFPGGLPIFENGELVGAIGVSGDVVDADEQIAQAGVDAFKSLKNATVELPTITQSTAAFIGETAAMKATEIDSAVYKAKVKMHVHVIGAEGTLLYATQAENAWPGSDDIATKKARTSRFFKLPSRTIGELSRVDKDFKGPLFGIELSNEGLISFPGGLPLFDTKGNCVGAVGVSGDAVDKDEEVARVAVDAFTKMLK